jgi:hypothetical protein
LLDAKMVVKPHFLKDRRGDDCSIHLAHRHDGGKMDGATRAASEGWSSG